MFRKWKYMHGQQKKVSKQFLQDLINANKISRKILSKNKRPKDVTPLKVNPTNEGGCSEEFLEMLTTCSMRIGDDGSKRLDVLSLNSSGASEGISLDDSVNALGELCFMLYEANLFTARDVVIAYIEKQLQELIANISEERASYWEKLAKYGLSLSEEDVLYLERADRSNKDLWNYIINDLCPQISVDWKIFAVNVLDLENLYVVDIIEHTKDEKGQVLSMFRKWRYMYSQQQKVSKQLLQNLVKDNELSGKIMSKDNRLKDVTALKVKPTNEGDCSREFLAVLTTCDKRIGVVGSKRLAEINSKGRLRKFLVAAGVVGTSAESPEGISVDDSVESLGQLCLMLSKANLFTARYVVITYIEKKLHKVIATISKERASDWDKFAKYGLCLSGNDVVYIERASQSNEARVSMAISKWMRKKKINIDVLETLTKKSLYNFSGVG